jgi:hypothetical protein
MGKFPEMMRNNAKQSVLTFGTSQSANLPLSSILLPFLSLIKWSYILPIVKVPSNGLSHANHVKGGIFGAFTRQTINLLEIEAPSWVHPQDGLVLATNTLQLDKLMKTEPRDTKGKTRVPNWRTQLGLA